MADGRQAITGIRERFPDAVADTGSFQDQHWAVIRTGSLVDVCAYLRDDQGYRLLLDVTAAHWPDDEQPFELIYHLYNVETHDRIRLKCRIAEGAAVPTLCRLFKSADWNERETYDMFGIRFEGHPDLRRILMPDDYTDFPLRKEFPLYRG